MVLNYILVGCPCLVRGFAPKFPSLPIRTPAAQVTYTQNTTPNNICYSAETIFLRNSFSRKSFRYALNFHVKKWVKNNAVKFIFKINVGLILSFFYANEHRKWMANTQLIVLFVLHSKATIWWCYFFRKHEETECKWWMISNDIRLHGGRWYWHEFKKPQTVLNWKGKISGKGWARFSSSWECHCYTSAVSYNRKVTFSVIGGPLSEIGLCLF